MKHVLAAIVLLAACGDNSDECGPGTKAVFGVCTPIGSGGETVGCGGGTMFDAASDSCVPANGVCGDGTVLVAGTCQDPNAGLTVDLEEGPEPNGFAPGSAPAGTIELPASGAFVIHGCIQPVGNDADVDNYLIAVAGPMLVDITVAGTGGMVGGFVAEDAASAFVRYGIATASATTERDVFFPAAGTYSIAIADARTLIGSLAGDGVIAAGDATSCYYASVQSATPAPALAPQNTPVSIALAGKLQFYEAPPGVLPNGLEHVAWRSESSGALAAVQILDNGALREGATFGGVGSDDVIVVGDFVYDLDATATTFDFELATATAPTLPSNGSTVALISSVDPAQASQLVLADTASAFAIELSQPMQGELVDTDARVLAELGGLAGTPSSFTTFTSFHGAVALDGRPPYYLVLYGPSLPAGTPVTLASDSPTTVITTTTAPWVTIGAIGTNTGSVALSIFDAASAVGRLTPIELFDGTTTFSSPGIAPLVAPSALAPDDSNPDELAFGGSNTELVVATPLAATSGATLALDLEAVAFTALGPLSPGTTTSTAQVLPAGGELRYLVTAPPGEQLAFETVDGSGAIDANSAVLPIDVATHATPAPAITAVGTTAFAAFGGAADVSASAAIDVTLPAYVASPTTFAFVDACAGGGDITPRDALGRVVAGFGEAHVPAGLAFFGAAIAQASVSTDGFITFGPPLADAFAPSLATPGVNVAAFLQQLDGARICTEVASGALVVEWLTPSVQVEAIIDPSGTITFVFGAGQRDFGGAAVQGVQSSDGEQVIATGQGSTRPFAVANTGIVLAP
ncbi:MAG TPA: hypothetical protein VH143_08530 [Kofleriaceae bacterium]|jgi:hypothetical protein|nr:hypothetical protein [Kofleriaceae bacterium]